MNKITLRAAVESDALRIGEISVAGWQHAYTHILPQETLAALDPRDRADRISKRIADATTMYWVASYENRIAGFSCWHVGEHDPVKGEPFVIGLYVDPPVHGLGIGRKLLEKVSVEVKKCGFKAFTLSTFVLNDAARAFYQKCGGTEFTIGTWEWNGFTRDVVYIRFYVEGK